MEREIDETHRRVLWLERLAWNAAAGAVVAVLLLVLLWSLHWLDRIAPEPALAPAPVAAGPAPEAGSAGLRWHAERPGARPIDVLTRSVQSDPGGRAGPGG
ncbi:MAG: hypothetical protein H6748_12725 [Spirochaetaceae bacterium]|nr:hypothetical protein [Spirochaetaceae bacterium]HPG27156.1 hypothetical protein [Myxococcota bacterium]